MSQSLIVFKPSGRIEYQYNNKITPFNEFIYNIVNSTHVELEANFYTKSLHQKRFYGYRRDDVYAALYFDAVTTIDGDKIQQTLSGILKTYNKVVTEGDSEDNYSKLKKLVDLQFNQLMKLKLNVDSPVVLAPILARGTPSGSGPNSGTSTPVRRNVKQTPNKKMRKWDGDEMVENVDNSVLDYSASADGDVDLSLIHI